jgi:phenylacetate-CoA ligase
VSTDTVVLEVLDGDRPAAPGQPGRIVVTNLFSFAMPIIRYEVEDVGVLTRDAPPCGGVRPLLDRIEGRSDAFLVLRTGRVLSPMSCYALFKSVSGLLHWRVHQAEAGEVEVAAVPASGSSEDLAGQIRDAFRRHVGAGLTVRVRFVESVPPSPSGKARAVTSSLARERLRESGAVDSSCGERKHP